MRPALPYPKQTQRFHPIIDVALLLHYVPRFQSNIMHKLHLNYIARKSAKSFVSIIDYAFNCLVLNALSY